jgi:hypothetical protein
MTKEIVTAQQINAQMRLASDIRESIQDYGVMDVNVDQGKGISINFSKMEEPELLECKDKLNKTLADHTSPLKVRQSATASLTQVEGLLDVLHIVKEHGLDPSGMTAADVVLTATGKPIRVINKTRLGDYFLSDAEALKNATAKIKGSSVSATNKFANWLASKTKEEK